MYTTTSKQQEGCTFEDSHPECFITTNSTAKLSRGAVNRGVHVLRAPYTKVNSNTDLLPTLRPGNFDLHTKMPGPPLPEP